MKEEVWTVMKMKKVLSETIVSETSVTEISVREPIFLLFACCLLLVYKAKKALGKQVAITSCLLLVNK